MKRIYLSIVALLSAITLSNAAPSVDLTKATGCKIYSAEVGGQADNGRLSKVEVQLPPYKHAVIFASPVKTFSTINQLQPWSTTDISKLFNTKLDMGDIPILKAPNNLVFSMVLELESGEYMALQPISALEVTSWIEVRERNVVDLVSGGLGHNEVERSATPIFAYAVGDEMYGAVYEMWDKILKDDQVAGRTTWRDNKVYPEAFEYLGWCSWEQYRKNIDEALLVGAVDAIEQSSVPIRWVLIDDGHQTRDGKGALSNLEISKSRFPNGWKPIIDKRSDKIKWFGLWHCMFGEWKGISKSHTMAPLNDHLMPLNANAMMVKETQAASDTFYKMLIGSISEPGFDFAKIDVQTTDFTNYVGKGNAVVAKRQNAEALEAESDAQLNGLINCMAQNLPCVFNTRYSAVTRVSVDYKLNSTPLAIAHIYQSYQNTMWMGQTVWPDHDMFHSSDVKLGRLMAVSKAMSGAPIYLSDAPKDMLSELIMPLVYEDGKLLRPLAPAVPLPEALFSDALFGTDDYKVIAPMNAKSAAIVAYNISNKYVDGVASCVTADDYRYADIMVQPRVGLRDMPSDGLAYYDWYNKCGGRLEDDYKFELASVSDRLILLSEIEEGWSVIGLEDKYLSGVAVQSTEGSRRKLKVELSEGGNTIVYSETPIKRASQGDIEPMGNGLYRIVGAPAEFTLYR